MSAHDCYYSWICGSIPTYRSTSEVQSIDILLDIGCVTAVYLTDTIDGCLHCFTRCGVLLLADNSSDTVLQLAQAHILLLSLLVLLLLLLLLLLSLLLLQQLSYYCYYDSCCSYNSCCCGCGTASTSVSRLAMMNSCRLRTTAAACTAVPFMLYAT
jgi:hypothetical protein